MNARKRIAWHLRRLRVEQGLSQEALAVDAEIDRTYVSRVERMLENPTVGVLERLAKVLKVDVSAFFVEPRKGERAPSPLPKGRRPKSQHADRKGKPHSGRGA